MRFIHSWFYLLPFTLLVGCNRSSQSWEDLKTAGRYMQKGMDALWGKDYESRMLTSDEEFTGPYDEEFIPLKDSDSKNLYHMTDSALPQPKAIPGQDGIPSLEHFYTPPESLRALFEPVHFHTDDHVVRDKMELTHLSKMADFLKKNPQTFLIIEGHTDERASASYNLALGMRRANFIRSFLVKNGVNLNQLYTVSKGKELPLALGHTAEDWKLNRRSEFKMYQK